MANLKNKKILLCVTGSIAAYKSCEFIRLLKKQECHVQVVMTNSAQDFIGKLSLASLSGNEVLIYKTKKYGMPCERRFEVNPSGTIIAFSSSGCF